MSEFKEIKASCPCCHAGKDKIVYQNSGPIVRIYCSNCRLVFSDKDARDDGFRDLIDYWNHIGVYMPLENDLTGGGYQEEESVNELINTLIKMDNDM